MTKIEDYLKEIPEEIRHAIRGLASDYRAAIFIALYKHGELSFSELQKTLEIDKAKLNFHLGKLVDSALVQHYYKHELGNEKYSFYNATSFGQDFVENLSEFLRPRPCSIPTRDSNLLSGVFEKALGQFQIVLMDTVFFDEIRYDRMRVPFMEPADANDPTTIVVSPREKENPLQATAS